MQISSRVIAAAVFGVVLGVSGCGVETAATAAAGGASKATQAAQAKHTVDDVRGRLAKAQEDAAKRSN